MAEKDQYREKFRPDADPNLDRELEAALSGVSVDSLLESDAARAAAPGAEAGAAGGKGPRRGRIVSIDKDQAFVDLGGKSQGIVSLMQFADDEPPVVGQEMEFFVDRYDPREGLLVLTRKGAVAENVSWENLEVGQIVEGEVTGMNKGGLELKVKSMRAFMPSGQVDLYFQKDISTFIGQRLKAEVTQFDREKKNLVVSRRNILEREKEEARQKLLEQLAVGQMQRGTVRSVTEYGAFVDLGGGVDGLIHISELSHRRVKSASEIVKEGDMVDVKVVKIDKETGKIGLSLKQAMADPWQDVQSKYAVGSTLTARVAKVESFGAFLEVEEGIEGLLPVSEISWQRIRHPSDVVKEGDTVKVVVISLDPSARRMSFSMKQAGGDPWAGVEGKYPTNSVITGKVTRTADFGAFVELEAGLEGLVHISELANNRVRAVGDVAKPGQEVKVRVLEIDKDKRRISLSIKRADEPVEAAPAPPVAAAPKKKRPQLRGGLDF